MSEVVLNKFGYYELTDKPTSGELERYYADKYFQNERSTYRREYGDDEIKYFNNKIEQKYRQALSLGFIKPGVAQALLDVGCGEGFTLRYFYNLRWNVLGLDYTDYACKRLNPDCAEYIMVGNVYDNLKKLADRDQQFDVIWLDNILEHVLDPLDLLTRIRQLISSQGCLIIEVPNDFSAIQMRLLEIGAVDNEFWIVSPDHISYFNAQGLKSICNAAGWQCNSVLADFPIDIFLFNKFSNYVCSPATGKQAHAARIEVENLLSTCAPDAVNNLYEAMAEVGLGRQLIGFFTPHT